MKWKSLAKQCASPWVATSESSPKPVRDSGGATNRDTGLGDSLNRKAARHLTIIMKPRL
jgi:hypothetical protein